jgi:cation diffusion facilitator CzcD-associated flavoprotein CzcO
MMYSSLRRTSFRTVPSRESAWPSNSKGFTVIVGGGISGLSAAHFYRKLAGPNAKILILDNHDDFGGHAKRNEFRSGDRSCCWPLAERFRLRAPNPTVPWRKA